ncbi:MAG TPA: hypothetical protein VJ251_11140, partial [Stellaceae bacterium]|nr:hypothetical protein [Stellaceae bacterium]
KALDMRQPLDHVAGDAHRSFLRGLGDEVSNFSNTISSNSSKGVRFFSARSTAPSQVLIRKDASTMGSNQTRISPCRYSSQTVGLGVAALEQHVVIA